MCAAVDIRPELKLPVFDPDYNRPQEGRSSRQQQPHYSSGARRLKSPSISSSGSDDDRSVDDRQPAKLPAVSRQKTVSFRDFRQEQERGRTAAGRDVSNEKAVDARDRPTKNVERTMKKTNIRRWRSLRDDAPPTGQQNEKKKKSAESSTTSAINYENKKKGQRRSGSATSSAVSQPTSQMTRPSSFTRFYYPVKFHRIAGAQTTAASTNAQRQMITCSFDVPNCLRRPMSIGLLPVRQGPDPSAGGKRTAIEVKNGRRRMTAAKETDAAVTGSPLQVDHDASNTSSVELNAVYSVTHVERGSKKNPKRRQQKQQDFDSDAESDNETDPETAVGDAVTAQLSSRSSSSSTSSDSRREDNNGAIDDVSDDDKQTLNGSKKKNNRSDNSDDSESEKDNGNYSDDFIE